MTPLLHPVEALTQAGVRKRRAYRLVAALDRLGYKIVATSPCRGCGATPRNPRHRQGCPDHSEVGNV